MHTLEAIDAALAVLPEPITYEEFEHRTKLVVRRAELDQAARAAPRTVEAYPGLTAIIPERLSSVSQFVDQLGRIQEVCVVDGVRVVDVSPYLFRLFLAGPCGLDWERANEDNLQRLQSGVYA
jgi:hypothetical protein